MQHVCDIMTSPVSDVITLAGSHGILWFGSKLYGKITSKQRVFPKIQTVPCNVAGVMTSLPGEVIVSCLGAFEGGISPHGGGTEKSGLTSLFWYYFNMKGRSMV